MSFLDEEGKCGDCTYSTHVVIDNKFKKCDDVIKNCEECNIIEDRFWCSSCKNGYIFLINNNTCLKITENNGLMNFKNCSEIYFENNYYFCEKCRDEYYYFALNKNNQSTCVYLPELNGNAQLSSVFPSYGGDFDIYKKNKDIDYFYNYISHKYNLNYLSKCGEIINLGTDEFSMYSCKKCYYSNTPIHYYYDLYKAEDSNKTYCLYYGFISNYKDVQNCSEAKIKFIGNKRIITCAICKENNILVYNKIDGINYCKYSPIIINENNNGTNISSSNIPIKICMAKFCSICKSNDEYFCEICEFEDYEVNNITGACMKKIENYPSITWKDIFRLELNSQKEINGKTIKGPKLNLRGVTNSQINFGHAFIIYLIFKLKQSLKLRDLEYDTDTIKIKAICEVKNDVIEKKNDSNVVEYECIGDYKKNDIDNYALNDIEIDNDNIYILSNLYDLKSSKNLSELGNNPIVEFSIENIQNQTSKDYTFDFTIDGKIDDKNLKEITISEKLRMNEINESSNCLFIIEENKKSNLNCKINIKNYKNIKVLTFNTTKIEYRNEYNISMVNLNKIYLINIAGNEEGKSKVGIIIICVLGGIIIAIIITIIIIYIARSKRNSINKKIIKYECQSEKNSNGLSLNTDNRKIKS